MEINTINPIDELVLSNKYQSPSKLVLDQNQNTSLFKTFVAQNAHKKSPNTTAIDPKMINVDRKGKAGTDIALNKLRIVASEYEAVFLAQIWNNILKREKYEGGLGEEIFSQSLVEEIVKRDTASGGGQISDAIFNEFKEHLGK